MDEFKAMPIYDRDLHATTTSWSMADLDQVEGRILRGLGVKKSNPQVIAKRRIIKVSPTAAKTIAGAMSNMLKHSMTYEGRPRKTV